MQRPTLHLEETAPLPYLLSLPNLALSANATADLRPWPVLCFLHGYDEGAPLPIQQALTRHGPLKRESAPSATAEFIVVAPQLPSRGDLWYRYADVVQDVVRQVQERHNGDVERTFLTGFSYGGNGIFDLALHQGRFWRALWPVDPTRVPQQDLDQPVWLSSGEISRRHEKEYLERLHLKPMLPSQPLAERVYVDQGQDHVGTATLAYKDDRIYSWLLTR